MRRLTIVAASLAALTAGGCHYGERPIPGAPHDRPFPLGQVTDAHWETQQANAEAADFVFYDHEFKGDTVALAPGGRRHLEEVALRLPHVPFPVVIEESPHDSNPKLDQQRRAAIVAHLCQMGIVDAEPRVVVASAFAEGFTAIEGERAYRGGVLGARGGVGRRFGGTGGLYR